MHPEHLCLLSALDKVNGPQELILEEDVAHVADEMSQEILAHTRCSFSAADVKDIVADALWAALDVLTADAWQPEGYMRPPSRMEDSFWDTSVVLRRAEDGSIDVARVAGYSRDDGGWSWSVSDEGNLSEGWASVGSDKGNPFFCWYRVYLYAQCWISAGHPSQFDRDFYTLVDDYREPYNEEIVSGLLTCIDYGGLERTYHDGFQDFLAGARAGSKRTALAVASGKRGEELWPAIAHDYGAWMCVKPDIWPEPSAQQWHLGEVTHDDTASPTPFANLPMEIILHILRHTPFTLLVTLTAVSRLTRRMAATLSNDILSHHIYYGELRWILPVRSVPEDTSRAERVVPLWCNDNETEGPLHKRSPFDRRGFPYFAFVKMCFENSLSMMNRRRLWGIAKQYERLGRESGIW